MPSSVKNKSILVTGGAGYIGSHTCVELLEAGYTVSVLDNFSNSSPEVLARVQSLTGQHVRTYRGDIRDAAALDHALSDSGAGAVVHFAGLKSVGESVAQPLRYYDNNVVGTVRLLEAMGRAGVNALVFSSSATVYGEPQSLPLTEDHPLSATNPYGRTKLVIEDMLRELHTADPSWRIGILRYFNPVGAHASGRIGEDPLGVPNNLLPYVAQVAVGRRERLSIWGSDYPTHDGTGLRDYIHVVDLAQGHVKALERLHTQAQCFSVNLGTGTGYSVLEIVRAFEQASGRAVPYQLAPRRAGDVAACYADPRQAAQLLGWRAERDLATMCRDAWKWQDQNPQGFASTAPA
ncbi:MAG: UDP-glucose 4-epimerase GalE [Simplicispira sp.]|nr:UDP-glucose 4-epimerase GalE [Simplicispira sp.]